MGGDQELCQILDMESLEISKKHTREGNYWTNHGRRTTVQIGDLHSFANVKVDMIHIRFIQVSGLAQEEIKLFVNLPFQKLLLQGQHIYVLPKFDTSAILAAALLTQATLLHLFGGILCVCS